MTSPNDIAALVAWLRSMQKRGGKGGVDNVDARALGRVADALEKCEAERAKLANDLAKQANDLVKKMVSDD